MLDLAKRLAEEYDAVPLAQVSRSVKAAADAARLFGEDVTTALPTIAPSATPLSCATCRGSEMPKPTHTGLSVSDFMFVTPLANSGGS